MSNAAIARAIVLTALAGIILYAAYLTREVLLLIYISILLSIGLGPIVRRIEGIVPHNRIKLPRWFAILVIYLVLVGVLTTIGLLVVPPLVEQSRELWRRLPELIDQGQALLMRYGLLDHSITLEEAVRQVPGPGDAVGTVGTVAMALTGVFTGLFAFVTILILTFYLLLESDTLFAAFVKMFPGAERARVEAVATKISTKVSAWLNGQLILASSIGMTAAIGLYFLGVPYFYVLALIAAFGEMIPVVGPIFSAVPTMLVALSVSPRTALFTGLFLLAQQQLENHILVPKVMERQVGVSAVTVIVALLVGGSLLGILGALLAVPSAAIIQVVVQELLEERDRLAEQRLGPHFE